MTPHIFIFSVIQGHRGSGNAISALAIASEIGLRPTMERDVRRIISEHSHEWPEIVCARLKGAGEIGGYFVAETFEEIQAYFAWLDDLRFKAEEKVRRFEANCARAGFNLSGVAEKKTA